MIFVQIAKDVIGCMQKRNAKYVLECICGSGCPCRQQDHFTHLNLVRKNMEDGLEPPDELPPVKYINVRGRIEHEAVIKDSNLCKAYGLDQMYETILYLRRWGGWLSE